jgi:hypothetical protein
MATGSLPEYRMTRSFHVSRLAEIAEALPVEPVSFPGRGEVATLRRTLKRWRGLLAKRRSSTVQGPDTDPAERTG